MIEKLKDNKMSQTIKKHPYATAITSGSFITLIINILNSAKNNGINFSQIIEWISKLKSLIQGCSFSNILIIIIGVIIITCIICIYKYKCKKLDIKEIEQQNAFNAINSVIEKDTAVDGIIINDGKDINTSIVIQRNDKIHLSKAKGIIKFPTSKIRENE